MSKFTEMMLHAEEEQALIAEWLPDRKQAAADWRAMREAWEELISATAAFLPVAQRNLWPTPDKPESDFGKMRRLEAALAKARVV